MPMVDNKLLEGKAERNAKYAAAKPNIQATIDAVMAVNAAHPVEKMAWN